MAAMQVTPKCVYHFLHMSKEASVTLMALGTAVICSLAWVSPFRFEEASWVRKGFQSSPRQTLMDQN